MTVLEDQILAVDYAVEPSNRRTTLKRPSWKDVVRFDLSQLKWTQLSRVQYCSTLELEGEGKIFPDIRFGEELFERPEFLIPLLEDHEKIYFLGSVFMVSDGYSASPYIRRRPGMPHEDDSHTKWEGDFPSPQNQTTRPWIFGSTFDYDWDPETLVPYFEASDIATN